MRLNTLTLAGAAALALGCSKDPSGGPQTIRETGYIACRIDAAGCDAEEIRCDLDDGTSACVARPVACTDALTCACAGEALCGDAICRDFEDGLQCRDVRLDASTGYPLDALTVDARAADAAQDALPTGPDVLRPDAYLCDLILPELGLSLSPFPAEPTGGDLVARTLAPNTVTLTIRTNAGGGTDETYTLTGPFAALPEEALPLGSHVNIQTNGGAFVLRAGPCDWAPLEVIAGTWPELAPLIGPVTPSEELVCACPRNSQPAGQTRDTMQSHITYGQFFGCAEDSNVPSRFESVSVPRRDAPACPGGPAKARGPAVDMNLAFAPEDDTPENRTQFLYSGLVALADAPSPDGVPGFDVTPVDPPGGFRVAHVTWPSDVPLPAFSGDTFAILERRDTGFWTNTRVVVTDARGLALSAVDADASWGAYEAGTGFVSAPAECVTRAEQQPGVFSAQDGHPVQIREADADGAPWPAVRLGDTEVTIRGQRYAVDVRASHTWQNACSTDDTGGWISLALARAE
jgi:hypothetical protein